LTRPRFAPALWHQFALVAAFAAMVALALLSSSGTALAAGVSGQQEAWSANTEAAPGELFDPHQLGVDPEDGSIFTGSFNATLTGTVIQKWSDTGDFEGSVELPGNGYVGIAVDAEHDRFYVLETLREENLAGEEGPVAQQILAFSTNPVENASHEMELVAATQSTLPVPDPTGAEQLFRPREIAVDPSSGDLIVLAEDDLEEAVLQRIDVDPLTGAGTLGASFVDGSGEIQSQRAMAIDGQGVTFVFSRSTAALASPVAATLPVNFTGSSTLTPVPGFSAAVGNSNTVILRPPLYNWGPQFAVSTSSTGEDTIFWKSLLQTGTEYLIESYSVKGETRSSAFGGGTAEGSCKIQTEGASLAAGLNGSLVVLDQGSPLTSPTETPAHLPFVFEFGPGGSSCPAPAPAFKFEAGGHVLSGTPPTVPAGMVTFNGSDSELNGTTLQKTTWKVEGPESFTESVNGATPTLSHTLTATGTYTVRMAIEASTARLGKIFSAQPQTLVVTAAAPAPTITGVTPHEGPTAGGTLVTITGTNLAGAGEVKFGTTPVACPKADAPGKCVVKSGTEIEVEAPAHAAGTVDVHAVVGGTESASNAPGDQFTYNAPVVPKFTLTVSKAGSGSGTVAGSPAGIDCGGTCVASLSEGTSVTLTATAASGSTFAGWGGACSGTGPCVVAMNAAKTVTATFNSNPPAEETKPTENKPTETKPTETKPTETKPTKTKAQILAEKRNAAIKKCKKLSGKAEAKCLAKARQIGKPKKKAPKKKKAAGQMAVIAARQTW
jgi:hypothetical protein